RARLTRRGLTLSGVLLAAALSEEAARAAVPVGLVASTTRAVSSTAGASATVIALADAALRGVPMTKLQLITAALLLGATAGTGLLIGRTRARPPEAVRAVPDPLPSGAGHPPAGKDENANPATPAPAPSDPARRLWSIIQVVQANHLEP